MWRRLQLFLNVWARRRTGRDLPLPFMLRCRKSHGRGLYPSLPPFVCVRLSVCVCMHAYVCLTVFLSVNVCVCVCLSVSVCWGVCANYHPSPCTNGFICMCVSVSLFYFVVHVFLWHPSLCVSVCFMSFADAYCVCVGMLACLPSRL